MARHATDHEQRIERVKRVLDGHAAGMHWFADPALVIDSDIPAGLAAAYRCFDGAELFHEALVLRPSRDADATEDGLSIGEVSGDELLVASDGTVLRRDADSGELIKDGTSFDRWLAGWVDAEASLYDDSGEFLDDVIDDSGELLPDTVATRERLALKRDPKAPGPRFRLATALRRQDRLHDAREELEQVVANDERFAWAWYDLARISEAMGDLGNACEELQMAVAADPEYPHNSFFYAHAARLYRALGDKPRQRDAAARALQLDPDFARQQREAAQESLEEGVVGRAEELVELALALAPTDLSTLALAKKIRGLAPN